MTQLAILTDSVPIPDNDVVRIRWQQQSPPPRQFLAAICPEEEGGFSAFALHYPGVISQGDSLEEARSNIAEAFLAMLESRRKRGEDMRFSYQDVQIPRECKRIWVSVDG